MHCCHLPGRRGASCQVRPADGALRLTRSAMNDRICASGHGRDGGESMAERVAGKRAVITGAASGIGEATARLFVAEGASVVLADLDEKRGERLAGELGDRSRFVPVDVAREGDIDEAIATSVADFGGLDCLFNNAGNPGSIGEIEEIDLATFDRTVAVHL